MLIRILNRLFKPFYLRLIPITQFQLEVERLVRSNRKIKFVQVGANDGVRFDDLYFTVTSMGWSGIVIEPMTEMFKRLVLNYSDHPNVTPLNVALHPTKTEAVIFHVANEKLHRYPDWVAGIASMRRKHLEDNHVNQNDIVAEIVPCLPLMKIVEDYRLEEADLLQIDTEGFDAEIIRMIDFRHFRPKIIKYEHGNLDRDDEIAIAGLLSRNGYTVHVDGPMDTVALLRKHG